MSEAIAQKLDEARALIEKGWTRGKFKRGECYCALGAIATVTTGHSDPDAEAFPNYALYGWTLRLLRDAIGLKHISNIVDWNDAQKSKKPVIEAFRKAALRARSEAAAVGGR